MWICCGRCSSHKTVDLRYVVDVSKVRENISKNCYREIDDEVMEVGDEGDEEEVLDGEELPPESESESESEDEDED